MKMNCFEDVVFGFRDIQCFDYLGMSATGRGNKRGICACHLL